MLKIFHRPDRRRLESYARRHYSQNGEDGIIQEIFKRIKPKSKRFVEIGVDLKQNNTRYLLENDFWVGAWIDCQMPDYSLSGLRTIKQLITVENANQIIGNTDIDLLSIDIDLNTYHVLNRILQIVKPIVIVTEYNGTIPPDILWIAEYKENGAWDGSNYFGASLKAFELMCDTHGYSLVGCDPTGTNAFFIRSELALVNTFMPPFTSENHYYPLRQVTYR